MTNSYLTLNRNREKELAKSEELREQAAKSGKKTLSDARALPDEVLLEKLRSLNLPISKDQLEGYAQTEYSVQNLAEELIQYAETPVPEEDRDWVWLALVCLWERWFPDEANMEMLDDRMHEGKLAFEEHRPQEGLHHWGEAAIYFLDLTPDGEFLSLDELQTQLGSDLCLYDWLEHFTAELRRFAPENPAHWRTLWVLCDNVIPIVGGSEKGESLREKLEEYRSECGEVVDQSVKELDGLWRVHEIIEALEQSQRDFLPRGEMAAARAYRQEVIPGLIQSLEKIAARGQEGEKENALPAIFLLTEFGATAALPAILAACSLADYELYETYDEIILDYTARIVALLAAETPELVFELIADQERPYELREAIVWTSIHFVRDGVLTREAAIDRLTRLLKEITRQENPPLAGVIVDALDALAPHPIPPEVTEAFEKNQVDPSFALLEDFIRTPEECDAYFKDALAECDPTGIENAIEELSQWLHQDDEYSYFSGDDDYEDDEEIDPYWEQAWKLFSPLTDPAERIDQQELEMNSMQAYSTNIRNVEPHVGRNDPCPCGSGKKYKKCCARKE